MKNTSNNHIPEDASPQSPPQSSLGPRLAGNFAGNTYPQHDFRQATSSPQYSDTGIAEDPFEHPGVSGHSQIGDNIGMWRAGVPLPAVESMPFFGDDNWGRSPFTIPEDFINFIFKGNISGMPAMENYSW